MQQRSRCPKRCATAAAPRKRTDLRADIERCRASVNRALKREVASLARLLAWSLETVATTADLAVLRDEIRELRRPR